MRVSFIDKTGQTIQFRGEDMEASTLKKYDDSKITLKTLTEGDFHYPSNG